MFREERLKKNDRRCKGIYELKVFFFDRYDYLLKYRHSVEATTGNEAIDLTRDYLITLGENENIRTMRELRFDNDLIRRIIDNPKEFIEKNTYIEVRAYPDYYNYLKKK